MPAKFDSELADLDDYASGENENDGNNGFEFYEITPDAQKAKPISFPQLQSNRRSQENI